MIGALISTPKSLYKYFNLLYGIFPGMLWGCFSFGYMNKNKGHFMGV
jgi:hypothetical protein